MKMKDVEFVWVPSHFGLEQNEEANQIAKIVSKSSVMAAIAAGR